MATSAQRQALLAVPCPWCRSAPGELCAKPTTTDTDTEGGQRRPRRSPITTLDGGCHDARWQAAGLGSAPVLAARVAELNEKPVSVPVAREVREPVTVGGVPDRPW